MLSLSKRISAKDALMIAYCALTFLFVLYRAWALSFTFDEVTTTQIVHSDEWSQFGIAANNHLLNSVLIKCSMLFLAPSELAYRLPNVLAFLLYLVYAVRIGKLLSPAAPHLPLMLITAIPFVLDFFSLARGYGLSLSFMLPSVYFLLKYYNLQRFHFALLSLTFGMLMVLAHYTSINFFIPLVMLVLLKMIAMNGRRWLDLLTITGITTAFMAFVVPIMFQLKNNHELGFGGRSDLYHDTILSLSRCFAYHELNVKVVDVAFAILFALCLVLSLSNIIRCIVRRSLPISVVLPVMFLTSLTLPIVENLAVNAFFPTERTAVLYLPVMLLVLVNGSSTWIYTRARHWTLNTLTACVLGCFVFTINLTSCYSWKFDSGSKDLMEILMSNTDLYRNDGSMHLGVDYLYAPSIIYYKNDGSFNSLQTYQVIPLWDINVGIEEIDPQHYGQPATRKTNLTEKDGVRIMSEGADLLYLHDHIANELMRLGYELQILWRSRSANASLFKLKEERTGIN